MLDKSSILCKSGFSWTNLAATRLNSTYWLRGEVEFKNIQSDNQKSLLTRPPVQKVLMRGGRLTCQHVENALTQLFRVTESKNPCYDA